MEANPRKAPKMASRLLAGLCDSPYVCAACGKEQPGTVEGETLLTCCGKPQCPACVARSKATGRCCVCGSSAAASKL
jgi:hypothetical protein